MEDHEEYVAEEVIRCKWNRRANSWVRDFLASWLGFSAEHNTWEPARNVKNHEQLIKRFLDTHNLKATEQEKFLWGWQ